MKNPYQPQGEPPHERQQSPPDQPPLQKPQPFKRRVNIHD